MNGPLNHRDWGKPRLRPRSFVISLPTPSNYVGPDLVFGSNHEDGMEAPLPLIRYVDKRAEGWIAEGHKKQPLGRYTQRGLHNRGIASASARPDAAGVNEFSIVRVIAQQKHTRAISDAI
jgi:hypothetical protein